jgi:hypothetical protein
MDPARIFTESLTPRPELENSQGHSRLIRPFLPTGQCPLRSENDQNAALPRSDARCQYQTLEGAGRTAASGLATTPALAIGLPI